MDTRKIIAFGKSTFSITLPKKWVEKNKLKKGDTVSLLELPLGRLEVSPSSRSGAAQPKTISIPVSSRPIKEIQREFIAAYIKGYSIINLVGNHGGMVSELRRRLHEMIAVEIMEVAPQRITAHVFSDTTTISLPKIISRIELITKTLFEETQSLLANPKDADLLYKELMEKKREVDRQSLFAIRIIVNALTDPVFASTIGEDPLSLSFIWHMVEHIERTSDYMLSIAFYLSSTDTVKKLSSRGRHDLHRIFSAIKANYEAALSSYNKKSLSLANEVFDTHKANDRVLSEYVRKYQLLWIPLITGYLRRTSSKSRDIAKITINMNTS